MALPFTEFLQVDAIEEDERRQREGVKDALEACYGGTQRSLLVKFDVLWNQTVGRLRSHKLVWRLNFGTFLGLKMHPITVAIRIQAPKLQNCNLPRLPK